MNTANATTNYQFTLHMPASKLANPFLMFDPDMRGCGGINTRNLEREYPDKCRKHLGEWLAICERDGKLGGGPILIVSWRNLIQNPRDPAYTKELGICQSALEQAELSRRPYRGISFLSGGRLRADVFLFSEPFPDDVQQFGSGIPVLWDGRVQTIEEMAPEVADFAHLWKLRVSTTQGSEAEAVDRYKRLQAVFERCKHATAEEASRAIMEEARGSKINGEGHCMTLLDSPLAREDAYLHNAVGVDADGGLVVVIANGSLEKIGELAQEAGAVSAVVVDNGGSCQVSLRRKPDGEIRPLVESYYHRPRSIAVAVFEMTTDAAHFPLVGQRDVGSNRTGIQFISSRREALQRVGLRFETGIGTVSRELTFSKLDGKAAEIVAIEIGNFTVIHGASSVAVDASPEFAARVRSKFWEKHRVMPRCMDPTTLRAMWLENYCEGLYGQPFTIRHSAEEPPAPSYPVQADTMPNPTPASFTLGLDVGATNIKCVVLRNGAEKIGESTAKTRPPDPSQYTSTFFEERVRETVGECCAAAKVKLSELGAVGISWAGAVMNGKAATSKTSLDMKDILNGVSPNLEFLARIRSLGPYMHEALKLNARIPVAVFNDGEVEVAYEANVTNRRGVLLCKLGATVAGGFIDHNGISSPYLTELGRCVLRTDLDAPRHPVTRTLGVASALIGSIALAQFCGQRGVTSVQGAPISKDQAGHELSEVITSNSKHAGAALEVIREMSLHIAHLLIESVHHLKDVRHILLRGGPIGSHVLGNALRSCLNEYLPAHLREMIIPETPEQHSGAYAAAWLAARRVR